MGVTHDMWLLLKQLLFTSVLMCKALQQKYNYTDYNNQSISCPQAAKVAEICVSDGLHSFSP